ncbi:PREDICTED: tumor necrosis factor receptor superfamily member 25 [Crocodylus porosus]|uniref:tumor necrosis factor receptor superfamily member 25 n=1 Tax=Crocodylus porosus TaxID=8502 RepID=UPI000938B1E4|nr:PREDICTED: tumor necrosis factor receptor superfamily member 25 [Crocodylus porosus]
MKSWSLTVAWVCLTALLVVTGSRSEPPGPRWPHAYEHRDKLRRERSPLEQASKLSCPAGQLQPRGTQHCCQMCPPGTFMESPCAHAGEKPTCRHCPTGTFLSACNTMLECHACSECDAQVSQVVLKNCTAASDVVCGCRPGYFQRCSQPSCEDFTCTQCRQCRGRSTRRNCSSREDTQCGDCQPGFFLEGSECQPCASKGLEWCGDSCEKTCGNPNMPAGTGLEYLFLCLIGPLLLGALVAYHKRRQLSQDTSSTDEAAVRDLVLQKAEPPCLPDATAPRLESQNLLQPNLTESLQMNGAAWAASASCSLSSKEPHQDAPSPPRANVLQQGSQLYEIIDTVPVRRWKEFMRVLELRDAEIEVVEMEFTHVRDQQYEMLKRWCQQRQATPNAVIRALERMELSGCAEELRHRLQCCS